MLTNSEELTNVTNELENDNLSPARRDDLNDRYAELTTPKAKPKGWTRDELESAIIVYRSMLQMEKSGEKFSKAALYKLLHSDHPERSAKSFEFRMQNISHVYDLLGRKWVTGLKPAKNAGTKIIIEIKSIIKELEQ
jgi:5-methylcytosine-specific restriction protein A